LVVSDAALERSGKSTHVWVVLGRAATIAAAIVALKKKRI